MELSKKEMFQVKGGIAWETVAVIGAAVVYIIGIISGYTNPAKCNN